MGRIVNLGLYGSHMLKMLWFHPRVRLDPIVPSYSDLAPRSRYRNIFKIFKKLPWCRTNFSPNKL